MVALKQRTPAVKTPAPQIPRLRTKETKHSDYKTVLVYPQLGTPYLKVGPGSWRHIGAIARRVVVQSIGRVGP